MKTIVRFLDGTYGVRKGMFPWTYQFLDSENLKYWWTTKYNHHARFKTYEQAYKAAGYDVGAPIN